MAAEPVVLGVDLGTTNAKAAAYGLDGGRVAEASVEVGLADTPAGRAEQDPDEVLRAVAEAVAEVTGRLRTVGRPVVGVGFSGAMHSVLAVDGHGRPLTHAVLWADGRAAPQVAAIARRTDVAALVARTGTPLHPMAPLAKLRWWAEEEPELAARAARWVSLKEHVLAALTGQTVVDHSIASATGLLDIAARDWDPEALTLAGVSRERLSPLVHPSARLDGLVGDWADRLGLPPDVPLVAGASDGPLANLGTGAVEPGVASLTVGTSGAVRLVVDRPQGDPTGRLFCYAGAGDDYVVGGAVNNGGLALKWARDRLLPELASAAVAAGKDPFDAFDDLAGGVPPGAGGLVFLPHLAGERAPRWVPGLRGALVGLTLEHGREHVLRALLEGVVLHLATVVEALRAAGHAPGALRASGGFTASPLWLSIAADVLGMPLTVPARVEGSAFGAALVAMDALGLADARALSLGVTRDALTVDPDPGRAARYRLVLDVYRRLEADLADDFAAIAALSPPTV